MGPGMHNTSPCLLLTIRAQDLGSHDLLAEVGLAFLHALGEPFLLGLVDAGLDGGSEALRRSLGLLLLGTGLGAGLHALVTSQVAAEFGLAPTAIVEPDSVDYGRGATC